MPDLPQRLLSPAFDIGVPFRPSIYFTDTVHRQIRFPRSKKKRIRRKWAKQSRNWETKTVPKNEAYIVGGVLYAHPAVLQKMCDELNRRMENRIAREIFG